MEYSLRELECFLAVAEELSFTRAAKRLNLAQPPLSRHVRTLEEKIGAQLFTREPRGISLTTAGRSFYEEARDIPIRLSRAAEQARRCARGESARLRLGFVSAVMSDELTAAFRKFRQAHPSAEIMLHDQPPNDQLAAISEGRLDGGFVGVKPAKCPPSVRFVTWFREPLVCLVPLDHPLASRSTVALKDLRQETFVAVSRDAAPAFADHVRDCCRTAGFRPRIVLESPRAQAVALMVVAGSGIALLPAAAARLVDGSACMLNLEREPLIEHSFALKSQQPPPLVVKLAQSLAGRGA